MKQKINPEGVLKPPAPYSTIIKVDSPETMIFLAGVAASTPDGGLIGKGDILEQAKQVARNIELELKAAGATTKDIAQSLHEKALSESRKLLFTSHG